jgi:hypothetical protein
MRLTPTPSAPWWHQDFSATVTQNSSDLDLGRAAILLSAHRSLFVPDSQHVDKSLNTLEQLAIRASASTFEAWHRLLWIDVGLSGNGIEYHDVRNSFLPDVLDRGVGIPISLAVIGIEVGRRLRLPIYGVGMPGHFLLGYGPTHPGRDHDERRFVDPFNSGAVLDVGGAAERFASMFGTNHSFDEDYLRPTEPAAILIRMCANLKQNYARAKDIPGLLDIMRLRSCLPDTSITEGRELVRLLHARGFGTDALAVCDQIEDHFPASRAIVDFERDRIIAEFN